MNKSFIKELLDKKLSEDEIVALNSLLSVEIAEVETYNHAMKTIKDTELIPTLEQCRNSHALRTQQLRERIEDIGGTPVNGADFIGTLVKLAESGASLLNDQATVAVLTASENFNLQQYESMQNMLGEKSWEMVNKDLLPTQEKTQQTLSVLHSSMHDNVQ